jgi:hypothetical protein
MKALGKGYKEVEEQNQMKLDLAQIPASKTNGSLASFEAEDDMNESGTRQGNIDKVLAAMKHLKDKSMNGCTCREITCHVDLDYHETMRRLCDLEKPEIVIRGARRICKVKPEGRRPVTWWLKS